MDDDASSLKELLGDDLFEFVLGTGVAYSESSSSTSPCRSSLIPEPALPLVASAMLCKTMSNAQHSVLTLDDSEFILGQCNKNTAKKTKSNIRTWDNWYKSAGETRTLAEIPPVELDKLLAHFFTKARKKHGSYYEPDTLHSKGVVIGT